MKDRKLFILLGILVITSMACSCGVLNQLVERLPLIGSISETASTTPKPEQILPAETQLPEEIPTLNSDQNDQNQNLEEQGEGITQLNSYQSTLTISLQGYDQNGMQVDENVEFNQSETKNPPAFHFRSSKKNNTDDAQISEYFKIGESIYILNTELDMNTLPCTLIRSTDDGDFSLNSMEILTPETIFSDVEKGDLLEANVFINGIASDHYRVNTAYLNGSALNTQTAEIWVARESGYTIRFRGEGDGDMLSYLNGNDVSGKTVWMYDLTNVNQTEKIILPQVCLNAAGTNTNDIPIPANAVGLSVLGNITSFTSPDNPGVVSEYYQKTLPALGFVQTDISEFEALAILVYSKDSKSYSIIITAGDSQGSSILISVK